MADFYHLCTYKILAEQAYTEATQTKNFRQDIFKISFGWTLFCALILACGWGMNLKGVFDVGLIATIVCVLLSCVAFFVNALTYRHLEKKAYAFEEKATNEYQDLQQYAKQHKDTQLLAQLKDFDSKKNTHPTP